MNEQLLEDELYETRRALESMIELFEPFGTGYVVETEEGDFVVLDGVAETVDLAREVLYGGEGVAEEC